MSHQDNVFNGKNFVENYEIWAEGNNPVVTSIDTDSDLIHAYDALNTATGNIDAFITSFNKDNKPFSSWSAFLEEASGGDQSKKDAILAGFVDSYRAILNMGSGGPDDPPAGEWSDIVSVLGNLNPPQSINVKNQFINSFEAFLFDYPYTVSSQTTDPGTGDVTVEYAPIADANEFFAQWQRYMGITARIGSTGGDVLDYRQVYDAFGFDAADFDARMAQFILDRQNVSEGGSPYFIPSHNFDEWFEKLRQDYIHQNFVSSVDTGTNTELLVIDRILRLLISIIDILQRVSAVQANRLGFLTDWQSAYTDQLTDVPQFAQGDNPIGRGNTDQKNFRSEMNARMQAITEKIRSWRSAVQDQAKAMQSTINQSQDAANQQTQMATSIIQQLSTILSQIFR